MIPELSNDDYAQAWRRMFTFHLETLPDREIAWEFDFWRRHSAPGLAELCRSVLRDRWLVGFAIPGGAPASGLDLLFRRSNHAVVFRLIRDEAHSLLTAIRLFFWASR